MGTLGCCELGLSLGHQDSKRSWGRKPHQQQDKDAAQAEVESGRLHPWLRGGFSTGAMQRTASLAVGYRLTPQGFLQGKDLVPNLQERGILCRPIWCLFLLPQASMSPLLEAGPGPNSFRNQPVGELASLCRQLPAWSHSGPSNSCIFPGLASQSPCLLLISCALGLMGAHWLAEAPVPLAPWPRLLASLCFM